MRLVGYTKAKVTSTLELIRQLQAGDFPHTHALDVLDHLSESLREAVRDLEKVHTNTDGSVVIALCKAILGRIFDIYPLLGFVLRSTNVRNAFELHGPFLRLVREALGKNAKLLISSEWQFSPFTYGMPESLGLDEFVFIGIPASESGNALAIPLAGHEFGDNVWRRKKLFSSFSTIVATKVVRCIADEVWESFSEQFPDVGDKDSLKDIEGQQYWRPSWQWAIYQCEELFCDFIGLMLFREAYLHAFAYLIAPGLPGPRMHEYPRITDRVRALTAVADNNSIPVPDLYAESFEEDEEADSPAEQLLLSISDSVSKRLVSTLAFEAAKVIDESNLTLCSESEIDSACHNFSIGVPTTTPASLASIVNAAWRFNESGMNSWEAHYPAVFHDEGRRTRMLNDLVYKSIEALEIRQRQGE